ncbi:hypothetical protein F350042L8_27010 [Fusobacterium ulcerans]|nr:hypothetical protein DXA30_16800 [Fusobacterium ulcerans]
MENKYLKLILGMIYLIIFLKLDNLNLEKTIYFKIFYFGGICCILVNFTKNKFLEMSFFLLNVIIVACIYKYTYFGYFTFLTILSLFISFYFIISKLEIQNKFISLCLLFLLPYTIEKMVIYKFKDYSEIITLINALLVGVVVYKKYSENRRKNV